MVYQHAKKDLKLTANNNQKLVIDGGECVVNSELPGWPNYEQDEVDAVQNVLQSGKVNYWTGDLGHKFEQQFAAYFGVNYAVALANGSVALELALQVLNIGVGDEVIVTPRTFIATVSSICIKGATPVFADVDLNTQNITADAIQACITPRTKAIMLVHLAGWPCDMQPIIKIAKDNNLKLIEDCAQAHGAKYNNKYVGSFGDVATFSFCQDKIMTTGGEGGMFITNNKSMWCKAWMYKDHGKHYESMMQRSVTDKSKFQWVHNSFGSNLRMTEMQAAIGLLQLHKLDAWVEQRRKNADILTNCFAKVPALRITKPSNNITHAYYKYYAFIRPPMLKPGWSRDKIIQAINLEGISCFMGSCSEVYKEKAFVDAGIKPVSALTNAEELGNTSIMFNIHPTLNSSDIEKVCAVVEKVFKHASNF